MVVSFKHLKMHSELQKCIVNKKIGRTLLHHFRIFVAEYSKRIKCIKNNVTITTHTIGC